MVHFIQQYSRKEIFTIMQFKKQPIVQLEPLNLVSTVQLNTFKAVLQSNVGNKLQFLIVIVVSCFGFSEQS